MLPTILLTDVQMHSDALRMIGDLSTISSIEKFNMTSNINNNRRTCTLKLPNDFLFIKTEIIFLTYNIFISFIIPVTLIIFFYISLIVKLNQQSKARIKNSCRKVNILVFTIITVHLCCNIPFWVNQIALVIYYSVSTEHSHFFYYVSTRLSTIFQITTSITSASNPYLYALLNENFRKCFTKSLRSNRRARSKRLKSIAGKE